MNVCDAMHGYFDYNTAEQNDGVLKTYSKVAGRLQLEINHGNAENVQSLHDFHELELKR